MNKVFCDGCDKEIANTTTSYNQHFKCVECRDYNSHYHDSCLSLIYDKKYCPTHMVRAKNDQLIREYVKEMWGAVGFPGTISDSGKIGATIGPLEISIEPVYDKDAANLSVIELQIEGLAETKIRKITANLHVHDQVVKQLQNAIVRSLRSTKSSITINKKHLDEKVAKIDSIINNLMDLIKRPISEIEENAIEDKVE
jgi:hypothetical protein